MSGLCFSGFLRLSGMTRVLAGLSPDLRARRRASVPFSSRSFFRFAISALIRDDFRYSSPTLIDGFVGIGKCARIGIGDVNIAERLAADFVRRLPLGPLRIKQRNIFIGIPVRPAVNGDRFDVSSGVEDQPGRKCPEKIVQFIAVARNAFRSESHGNRSVG